MFLCVVAVLALAVMFTGCELTDPVTESVYYIKDDNVEGGINYYNRDHTTTQQAVDEFTDSITALRKYLDSESFVDSGYYMGVNYAIDLLDKSNNTVGNFELRIGAYLYTYPYEDEEGNPIYKYYDAKDATYYDENNAEGTRTLVNALEIHNEAIKKSDICIEWYNGATNEVLIGLYYDGINSNSDDPGNILYADIQGARRSFYDFGDTVLYQQLIRLLCSLSVDGLLEKLGLQDDAGTGTINTTMAALVGQNYKRVVNDDVISLLFYAITLDMVAGNATEMLQNLFGPFGRKWDPLTYKYLGFRFSSVSTSTVSTIDADMQSLIAPKKDRTENVLTDAVFDLRGVVKDQRDVSYDYTAHITFDYGWTYPDSGLEIEHKDWYKPFDYGNYEFVGTLYVPSWDSQFDALIRTDMQEFDNTTNNVFMEFRDIANGELMIGIYYKNEREYLDISGLEYMYGWIDLEQLGFPQVYDDHLDLAYTLRKFKKGVNNVIVSIVDGILNPATSDKKNKALDYIMAKTFITEKIEFSTADEKAYRADLLASNATLMSKEDKRAELESLGYEPSYINSYIETYVEPTVASRRAELAEQGYNQSYINTTVNNEVDEAVMRKKRESLFSANTETLLVDIELIKQMLEETGAGTFTTRQLINVVDSVLPYTLDQLAIMLGIPSAELMVEESYFTFMLDVDTNEMTMTMYTDLGVEDNEDSNMLFKLELTPTYFGEYVEISDIDFSGFKPLGDIYTYSGTLRGNFVFSSQEVVDLSKLLSATIGESSGLNTPFVLDSNTGLTFELIYDQFVTDNYVDDEGNRLSPDQEGGTWKLEGRSAFDLVLRIMPKGDEIGEVVLRLSSDDVSFNNDVYKKLNSSDPKEKSDAEHQMGYVWVSIECVKKNNQQAIPMMKIREDVFMASMSAYMNGSTKIEDNVSSFADNDFNLSLTSIISALCKDAYVVPEPEQMEITSSNDTLQSLFRVSGLIGNIKVDAGFTYRVKGLQSIKSNYYMYQVGGFSDIYGTKDQDPYNTKLHEELPTYFYTDYRDAYEPLDYDFYVYPEDVLLPDGTMIEAGTIMIFRLGAKKSVSRQPIEVASSSFFNNEGPENQDISMVRFFLNDLEDLIIQDGEEFVYYNYENQRCVIAENYIYRDANGNIYFYWQGLRDVIFYDSGTSYYYYDMEMALYYEEDDEENGHKKGDYVYLYQAEHRQLLFEYDAESVEVTAAKKTQYAPRTNGSFMGVVRRYYLTFVTKNVVRLGSLHSIQYDSSQTFPPQYYSTEDEMNVVSEYDDDGKLMDQYYDPIALFVMEPAEPLQTSVTLNVCTDMQRITDYSTWTVTDSTPHQRSKWYASDAETFDCRFVIDEKYITLQGYMIVTTVVIGEGCMGETVFPCRLIFTNRQIQTTNYAVVYDESNFEYKELSEDLAQGEMQDTYYVRNDDGSYTETADTSFRAGITYYTKEYYAENAPVVATWTIEPYDYLLAKYAYLSDVDNFNGNNYLTEKELTEGYQDAEKEFIDAYFRGKEFSFAFVSDNYLSRNGVKEDYIAYTYSNIATDTSGRTVTTYYNWSFDAYSLGSNRESMIKPAGGVTYIHTRFKGQLVAIQLNIVEREFAYVQFNDLSETGEILDTDDTDSAKYKDGTLIHGKYVANYYDQDSYKISTTPTFVFTDPSLKHDEYRVVFNMPVITGLLNKNYIFDESYDILWSYANITNVGTEGSYYREYTYTPLYADDTADEEERKGRFTKEILTEEVVYENLSLAEQNTDVVTQDGKTLPLFRDNNGLAEKLVITVYSSEFEDVLTKDGKNVPYVSLSSDKKTQRVRVNGLSDLQYLYRENVDGSASVRKVYVSAKGVTGYGTAYASYTVLTFVEWAELATYFTQKNVTVYQEGTIATVEKPYYVEIDGVVASRNRSYYAVDDKYFDTGISRGDSMIIDVEYGSGYAYLYEKDEDGAIGIRSADTSPMNRPFYYYYTGEDLPENIVTKGSKYTYTYEIVKDKTYASLSDVEKADFIYDDANEKVMTYIEKDGYAWKRVDITLNSDYTKDIVVTTLNFYRMFRIYAENNGQVLTISVVTGKIVKSEGAGDAGKTNYPSVTVRIQAECPQLSPVSLSNNEVDALDGEEYHPTNVKVGTDKVSSRDVGYYYVDPLRVTTQTLPNNVTVTFSGDNRQSSHSFTGLEWYSYFDADGKGHFVNKNGDVILELVYEYSYVLNKKDGSKKKYSSLTAEEQAKYITDNDGNKYYLYKQDADGFLMQMAEGSGRYKVADWLLEKAEYGIRVQTRIGNEVSGFKYITVTLKILSKEPSKIEFYTKNGQQINEANMQENKVEILNTAGEISSVTYYTYYADSFQGISLPTKLIAYFNNGTSTTFTNIEWLTTTGEKDFIFTPGTTVSLVSHITLEQDGEAQDVDLAVRFNVVCAQTELSDITVPNAKADLDHILKKGYYVLIHWDNSTVTHVGDEYQFVALTAENLIRWNVNDVTSLGLYVVDEIGCKGYISISTESATDLADGDILPTKGYIGLYNKTSEGYKCTTSITVKDFLNKVFEKADIQVTNSGYYCKTKFLTVKTDASWYPVANFKPTLSGENYVFKEYYEASGDRTNLVIEEIDGIKMVTVQYDSNDSVGQKIALTDFIFLLTNSVVKEDSTGSEPVIQYIKDKDITIYGLNNVLDVQDMLGYQQGNTYKCMTYNKFAETNRIDKKYFIPLADGNGAYDIYPVPVFYGGYYCNGSDNIRTFTLEAYDAGGNANYPSGYSLSSSSNVQNSWQLKVVYPVAGYNYSSEALGSSSPFRYNDASSPTLTGWYIEQLDDFLIRDGNKDNVGLSKVLAEFKAGKQLDGDVIPAEIIYGCSGSIVFSVLTPEGFRIRQIVVIQSMADAVSRYTTDTFSSNGKQTTKMTIDACKISIDNLYDATYTEVGLKNYFNTTVFLPTEITLTLKDFIAVGKDKIIVLSDVKWELTAEWEKKAGTLDYTGTKSWMNMAQAQVLGCMIDGEYYGQVTLEVSIIISSCAVELLEWEDDAAIGLSTLTVPKNGKNTFTVYVDSYNNASSPLLGNGVLRLPSSFTARYADALDLLYTFDNVVYSLSSSLQEGDGAATVTKIYYNMEGIDLAAMTKSGAELQNVVLTDIRKLSMYIHMGLGQDMEITFYFYDKREVLAEAVFSIGDEQIRETINDALLGTVDALEEEWSSSVNYTRISYNLTSIMGKAQELYSDVVRNNMPSANDLIKFNTATAMLEKMQEKVSSWTISGTFDESTFPTDEKWLQKQCNYFAYKRLKEVYLETVAEYADSILLAKKSSASTATQAEKVSLLLDEIASAFATNAYNAIIQEYMEIEFNTLFTSYLNEFTPTQFSGAIAYKNAIEGSFDTERLIRDFCNLHELKGQNVAVEIASHQFDLTNAKAYGWFEEDGCDYEDVYRALVVEEMYRAIYRADEKYNLRRDGRFVDVVADSLLNIRMTVVEYIFIRMGLKTEFYQYVDSKYVVGEAIPTGTHLYVLDGNGLYNETDDYIVREGTVYYLRSASNKATAVVQSTLYNNGSYLLLGASDKKVCLDDLLAVGLKANETYTKKEVRAAINACVERWFDFAEMSAIDRTEYDALKGDVIEYSFRSISRYDNSIHTIRRNLLEGTDFSGTLTGLVRSAVNNFMETVYREQRYVEIIKEARSLNKELEEVYVIAPDLSAEKDAPNTAYMRYYALNENYVAVTLASESEFKSKRNVLYEQSGKTFVPVDSKAEFDATKSYFVYVDTDFEQHAGSLYEQSPDGYYFLTEDTVYDENKDYYSFTQEKAVTVKEAVYEASDNILMGSVTQYYRFAEAAMVKNSAVIVYAGKDLSSVTYSASRYDSVGSKLQTETVNDFYNYDEKTNRYSLAVGTTFSSSLSYATREEVFGKDLGEEKGYAFDAVKNTYVAVTTPEFHTVYSVFHTVYVNILEATDMSITESITIKKGANVQESFYLTLVYSDGEYHTEISNEYYVKRADGKYYLTQDAVFKEGTKYYAKRVYRLGADYQEGDKPTAAHTVKKTAIADTIQVGLCRIDCYQIYNIVPQTYVVSFSEEVGGYSYSYSLVWDNDTVSGKSVYTGVSQVLYGSLTEKNTALNIEQQLDMAVIVEKHILSSAEAVVTASYLGDIEKYVMGEATMVSGYTVRQIEKSGNLSVWFVRNADGKLFLAEYEATFSGETVTSLLFKKLTGYDSEWYEMFVFENEYTVDKNTAAKVVSKQSVSVYNPYEFKVSDLPASVKIDGKYRDIVWKNPTVSLLGNVQNESFTLKGNIVNGAGQSISMEFYVACWNYAGIYQKSTKTVSSIAFDRKLDNGTYQTEYFTYLDPIKCHFSDYSIYSAFDYYLVSFTVRAMQKDTTGKMVAKTVSLNKAQYTKTSGETYTYSKVDADGKMMFRLFYPCMEAVDGTTSYKSSLLEYSVSDATMTEVNNRKNYILYWDATTLVGLLADKNHSPRTGSISLGNADVKSTLSALRDNTKTPVSVTYVYENISIDTVQVVEENLTTGVEVDGDGNSTVTVSVNYADVTFVINKFSAREETGTLFLNDKKILYNTENYYYRDGDNGLYSLTTYTWDEDTRTLTADGKGYFYEISTNNLLYSGQKVGSFDRVGGIVILNGKTYYTWDNRFYQKNTGMSIDLINRKVIVDSAFYYEEIALTQGSVQKGTIETGTGMQKILLDTATYYFRFGDAKVYRLAGTYTENNAGTVFTFEGGENFVGSAGVLLGNNQAKYAGVTYYYTDGYFYEPVGGASVDTVSGYLSVSSENYLFDMTKPLYMTLSYCSCGKELTVTETGTDTHIYRITCSNPNCNAFSHTIVYDANTEKCSCSCETCAMFDKIGDNLAGKSGQISLVMDMNSTFPTSGLVTLNESYIHYDTSAMKVRLLWNQQYSDVIDNLKKFVAYAYSDVNSSSRETYAVNLLMSWPSLSQNEQDEVIDLAIKYKKNANAYLKDAYTDSMAREDAYKLLAVNERYDFEKNPQALQGGSNSNVMATVLLLAEGSNTVYSKQVNVRVVFSDYKPLEYYVYQNNDYQKLETLQEQKEGTAMLGTARYVSVAVNALSGQTIPTGKFFVQDGDDYKVATGVFQEGVSYYQLSTTTSFYIAVRSSYWNETEGTNTYVDNENLSDNQEEPYNNVGEFTYRLLDFIGSTKQEQFETANMMAGDGYYLVEVSKVVWTLSGTNDLVSSEFVLKGLDGTYYTITSKLLTMTLSK